MMSVIASEPVGYWCLRGHSLQCRMVAGSSHRCLETIVTDSPCTYISIVMRVLQQPFNGIVSVGCFINVFLVFRTFLVFVQRTYLYKFAFAFVSSTNILVNNNIVSFHIVVQSACHLSSEMFRTIRWTWIRRTMHQDRVTFVVVLWLINCGI